MHETLGSVLRRYREEAGLSLERFEQLTKIPRSVLQHLESDNLEKLPGDFYIRKYLRLYAQYLKLKESKLVAKYEEQVEVGPAPTPQAPPQAQQRLIITPQLLKLGAIALIAVLIVGYLVLQVRNIFEEPFLIVTVPSEDLVITDNFIEIRGQAEKEADVYINNKQIFTDARGYFQTTLDLQQGINILRISAQKKHSQESIIFREILVQPPAVDSADTEAATQEQ